MLTYGTLGNTPSASFHRGTAGKNTFVKTIKLINTSVSTVVVNIEYTDGTTVKVYDSYSLASGDALEVSPSYPIKYTGTSQGLNIWANATSSVNCFLQGIEYDV